MLTASCTYCWCVCFCYSLIFMLSGTVSPRYVNPTKPDVSYCNFCLLPTWNNFETLKCPPYIQGSKNQRTSTKTATLANPRAKFARVAGPLSPEELKQEFHLFIFIVDFYTGYLHQWSVSTSTHYVGECIQIVLIHSVQSSNRPISDSTIEICMVLYVYKVE